VYEIFQMSQDELIKYFVNIF